MSHHQSDQVIRQLNRLQVAQDRETAVRVVRRGKLVYRYAYARAAETRDAGQLGQDYVALHENGQTLAFALCDGVGESFYGELAARFLGDALVEWLWNEVPVRLDKDDLCGKLSDRMRAWTGPASELVRQQPLPEGIPTLQLEALEEKRAVGSQSVFVCGRVDLPGSVFPRGRILLAWMGDSRARIWGPERECSSRLAGVFDAAERWSSSQGALGGQPHVFSARLRGHGGALTALMV